MWTWNNKIVLCKVKQRRSHPNCRGLLGALKTQWQKNPNFFLVTEFTFWFWVPFFSWLFAYQATDWWNFTSTFSKCSLKPVKSWKFTFVFHYIMLIVSVCHVLLTTQFLSGSSLVSRTAVPPIAHSAILSCLWIREKQYQSFASVFTGVYSHLPHYLMD